MKIIVDGELCSEEAIRVSPLSSGFAYGYGLFETIRFWEGEPLFFAEHLRRLSDSAAALGLEMSFSAVQLLEQARLLLRENAARAGVFKIVLWEEGSSSRSAVFLREVGERGPMRRLSVGLAEAPRVSGAFTSANKTLNYLEPVRELRRAKQVGLDEVLFLNERGELTEGAVSNVFFVSEGVLKTPARACGLLDGIIRSKVLELAQGLGILVEEGVFGIEDLSRAEEAFMSNSGWGIAPVSSLALKDRKVALPGEAMALRLREALLQLERESVRP